MCSLLLKDLSFNFYLLQTNKDIFRNESVKLLLVLSIFALDSADQRCGSLCTASQESTLIMLTFCDKAGSDHYSTHHWHQNQASILTMLTFHRIKNLNSFKPAVLFVGHRQTE